MGIISLSEKPLRVQLASLAALIECQNHALCQSLAWHFRHCQGDDAPIVVTYRIMMDAKERFYVFCDNNLSYCGASANHIIEWLMQNLTETLTARSHQHFIFHAAALADGEQGLILAGNSGRGKSTLATWLTANGFNYLSDELVAVTLDAVKMYGFTRPIILKRGTASVWQDWLTQEANDRLLNLPSGTVALEPEFLRADCVQSSATPRLLLFPCYAPNQSFTVERLATAKAAFHLMQSLINAKNLPAWGFRAATRLAEQTQSYKLTYPDVTLTLDWLQQTISKL